MLSSLLTLAQENPGQANLVLNVALFGAITLYLVSVRVIGTRWARFRWEAWQTNAPGRGAAPRVEGLMRRIAFPGFASRGLVGETMPESWGGPVWLFAPWAARAVSAMQKDALYRPNLYLQIQALLWLPSLFWNLVVLVFQWPVRFTWRLVWWVVWDVALGIPRWWIRVITRTRPDEISAFRIQHRRIAASAP